MKTTSQLNSILIQKREDGLIHVSVTRVHGVMDGKVFRPFAETPTPEPVEQERLAQLIGEHEAEIIAGAGLATARCQVAENAAREGEAAKEKIDTLNATVKEQAGVIQELRNRLSDEERLRREADDALRKLTAAGQAVSKKTVKRRVQRNRSR